MRGLKSVGPGSSSDHWKKHQIGCIADALEDGATVSDVATISPLLAGSVLFNQMVKLDQPKQLLTVQSQPSVTSLDPVYESLSYPSLWPSGSTILVDINDPDKWSMETLSEAVSALFISGRLDTELDTLVVLQPHQLTEVKKIFAEFPLRVQSLHPQWGDPAKMLALYRSVSHTFFVNTTRAADAAFCNFPNTLICSRLFIDLQKTDALWRVLENSSMSRLLPAVSLEPVEELSAIALIDNRLGDLQSALSQVSMAQSDDWLDEYQMAAELNKPVIHGQAGWRKSVQAIIDARISLRRKGQKLQEDPKQFCIDSRIPVLRALGRLLPARVAA